MFMKKTYLTIFMIVFSMIFTSCSFEPEQTNIHIEPITENVFDFSYKEYLGYTLDDFYKLSGIAKEKLLLVDDGARYVVLDDNGEFDTIEYMGIEFYQYFFVEPFSKYLQSFGYACFTEDINRESELPNLLRSLVAMQIGEFGEPSSYDMDHCVISKSSDKELSEALFSTEIWEFEGEILCDFAIRCNVDNHSYSRIFPNEDPDKDAICIFLDYQVSLMRDGAVLNQQYKKTLY